MRAVVVLLALAAGCLAWSPSSVLIKAASGAPEWTAAGCKDSVLRAPIPVDGVSVAIGAQMDNRTGYQWNNNMWTTETRLTFQGGSTASVTNVTVDMAFYVAGHPPAWTIYLTDGVKRSTTACTVAPTETAKTCVWSSTVGMSLTEANAELAVIQSGPRMGDVRRRCFAKLEIVTA